MTTKAKAENKISTKSKNLNNTEMEEITIYKFQLEEIIDALRMTSRIHNSNQKVTCHDRTVIRAKKYAENAINGKKDEHVPYA